jgi:hypothetical protein
MTMTMVEKFTLANALWKRGCARKTAHSVSKSHAFSREVKHHMSEGKQDSPSADPVDDQPAKRTYLIRLLDAVADGQQRQGPSHTQQDAFGIEGEIPD